MQRVAREPLRVELAGSKRRADPAVRRHRPLAARIADRDDDARTARGDRAEDLDSAPLELRSQQPAGVVVGPFRDHPSLRAELGGPRRDVRRLPARPDLRSRRSVVAPNERPVEPDDDVQDEVTERADDHA